MEGKKIVALVGVGFWGKNICRNLWEMGVLHSVYDAKEEIRKELKEKYPSLPLRQSFEELLEIPEVKAIVLATPAKTHYELAKEALLAGKDVFVEKPLSLNLQKARELVDLAQEKERVLMVGHILHYHPAVAKLKELVEKGTIGEIRYLYAHRLNMGRVRNEEDVLFSLAPHDVSVLLSLARKMPLSVSAFGGAYLRKGIVDTALVNLEFDSSVRGHIFVSWLHPFKEQRLVVVGSKGMLVFDDMSEEKLFLYPHQVIFEGEGVPTILKKEAQAIAIEKKEPLREELAHFVECVLGRQKPLTDGEEGLRVLRVLELAEASLREKVSPRTQKSYFVHESSYIDEDVEIGEGTKIWHFCHILRGSSIGKNCVIGQNVMIGPEVRIGDRCKIQNNVSIYKEVTLEDEVFCGPSCVFTNVYNPRAFIERKHEFRPTLVKKGATIGANATIVCGVTIGRYALVGAGAVVKKDVPDYALVVGVPARQIGWVCKCGTTLKFEKEYARCLTCGNEYTIEGGRLVALKENSY
ncbi:MAG: Gfo/Idh/MocA family oxidoreductase [Candidatus Caldatribacteriaceae bacterium]